MNMWPETEGGRERTVASRDTFKVHERRKNWGCKAYYCVLRHILEVKLETSVLHHSDPDCVKISW